MPFSLKKTTTICAFLFISSLIYLHSTPDNTRETKERPSKLTNISKPTTPSVNTTTDSIPSKNRPLQIKDDAGQLRIPEPSEKFDSYTYNHLNTNSDHEVIAAPEEVAAEELDAHWAFEKENYYINLFRDVESLAGFVLSEAQCEGHQCKLSFLLEEEKQKDDITNKLLERLLSESQELGVAFDLNAPSDTAVLYISTKEN